MPSLPHISTYTRRVDAGQVDAALGPFDALNPIGDQSGSGECWVAVTGTEHQVIKVVVHEHEPGRFAREVEALARLGSPRVMRVHDHGQIITPAGTFPYLRSDFVPGGNLTEHLAAAATPPDDATIREFLIELLRGLAELAEELFNEPGEPEWYSRFLLETHLRAWEQLLRGGRGRPTRVPRVLFITPLLRMAVALYPPYELRLVRVEKADEWLALDEGLPAGGQGELLDADLTAADLPPEDCGELAIHQFALTTNGYERMGSNVRFGELANDALEAWCRTATLPDNLRDLRCCLFFDQRRWHHFGHSFDDKTLRYTRALIREMGAHVPT